MWTAIKDATPGQRKRFLSEHPRALGKDILFNGEAFFDVDLLEALRNATEQVGHQAPKLYRRRTMIYQVTNNSKLFTDMSIAMENTLRELGCEPVWSRDEAVDESEIPQH